MNYILSLENETYPVEDIRLPSGSVLTQELVGTPFSFVSPVRLAAGERYVLLGDSVGYQLLVNGCFGFAYSLKYLVSGIIAAKEAAVVRVE